MQTAEIAVARGYAGRWIASGDPREEFARTKTLEICSQAVTKLEKLSVTLAEENIIRTSSPILRSLSSPSPHLVEALVESPLYERVNCRVRLLIDSGPSSWDGQVKRFTTSFSLFEAAKAEMKL